MRSTRTVAPVLALLAGCSSAAHDPPVRTESLADTAADAGHADGGAPDPRELPVGLAYNGVQQASLCGGTLRTDALFDRLLRDGIRSVALPTPVPGVPDSFGALRALHALEPDHEVVTVWLEDASTGPDELDATVAGALGSNAIYRPADLWARCPKAPTLRDAVRTCGWPTLDELRGRFLVVRTAPSAGAAAALIDYVGGGAQARTRLAFIAPDLLSAAFKVLEPSGDASYVLFSDRHGWPLSEAPLLASTPEIVVRNNAHLDSFAWLAMKQEGLHHIASAPFDPSVHPEVTTVTPRGSVFTCRTGFDGCAARVETTDAITMRATTGQLAGARDSFVFAEGPSIPDATWTTHVTGVAADPRARGCLMARASAQDDAAYIAVCREAGSGAARLHVRRRSGATTSKIPLGFDGSGPLVLALSSVPGSGGRCFVGGVVHDDGEPVDGQAFCFDAPLSRTGIAVSSWTASEARFVFADVGWRVAGAARSLRGAAALQAAGERITHVTAFPQTDAIGADAVPAAATCSVPLTRRSWSTVDGPFLLPGGYPQAVANSITVDDQGNLFAVGGASDAQTLHWIVRKGTQAGTTWTTVDDYSFAPGQWTNGNGIAFFKGTTGPARIVATGGINDANMHGQRMVRESLDYGVTWTIIDQGSAFVSATNAVTFDGSGTTYTLGEESASSINETMYLKKRAPGASVWTTPLSYAYAWPLGGGATGTDIAIDSVGSIFTVGYTQGDANGGNSASILVRRKLSTETQFSVVDEGQLAAGQDALASTIAEDKLHHVHYVVATANDAQGVGWGLVRQSNNGGADFNAHAGAVGAGGTVLQYRLAPGQRAAFTAVGVDRAGRVHVGGYANDASGSTHWIVLASADVGKTWLPTDDFQLATGAAAGAGMHFAEDFDGNLFLAGGAATVAVPSTADPQSTWMIRRAVCGVMRP